jgi:hypothetical protein
MLVRVGLVKAGLAALAIAVVLSQGIAAAAEQASEKVKLALQLRKGASYQIKLTMDQKITQKMDEKTVRAISQKPDAKASETKISQTISLGCTFEVVDVGTDGIFRCKVTYDTVLFQQDGPMGKIEYDSANPPDTVPFMAKGAAALAGQVLTVGFTPAGDVSEVKGADELIDRMIKQMELPDEARKAAEASLKSEFGAAAMKELMAGMVGTYPAKEVAIGDSWQKKTTISRAFPTVREDTWTRTGRKKGVATLNVASKIMPGPEGGKTMQVGGMKMNFSLSGTQEGKTEIQESTGWVIGATLKQHLSGRAALDGVPGAKEPVSWPISVEGEIRLESPAK